MGGAFREIEHFHAHHFVGLPFGFCSGYALGQVRQMGSIAGWPLLDDDGVFQFYRLRPTGMATPLPVRRAFEAQGLSHRVPVGTPNGG